MREVQVRRVPVYKTSEIVLGIRMEESVKKVVQSLCTFISEAQLSHCISVTADWDTLTNELPDAEQFSKHLTVLVSKLKNVAAGEDDSNHVSVGQPNDDAAYPMSRTEDIKPDIIIDPMLVQISASNTEIERRIQAFMERKQLEVDDNNCREFGNIVSTSSSSQESVCSCARTDAIFKSRSGVRSHVKVSKVVNVQGPQTRPAMVQHLTALIQSPSKSSRLVSKSPLQSHSSGIEERLKNMESHLKLRKGHASSDIFERIKSLENRILHLESVSPEYLDALNMFPTKRRRLDIMSSPGNQEYSIKDIDHRIQQLQESLLKKKLDFTQEFVNDNSSASEPVTAATLENLCRDATFPN